MERSKGLSCDKRHIPNDPRRATPSRGIC
uniref:Uncharacterized protein n=1 Tax=Rhizophora mucronata TaxID=61149 RepID=A0A2P2R444_RHIMU